MEKFSIKTFVIAALAAAAGYMIAVRIEKAMAEKVGFDNTYSN